MAGCILHSGGKTAMADWLPLDCEGKSVLDIGGYDGRAAKVALERGAASAILLDNGEWAQYDWGAPGLADERIKRVDGDFLDYHKPADIVICHKVIYHLRDPLAGLRKLHELTREWLSISTSF